MPRGGKREGAGRPKLRVEERRKPVMIRLNQKAIVTLKKLREQESDNPSLSTLIQRLILKKEQ
jgi:hypothetical protein